MVPMMYRSRQSEGQLRMCRLSTSDLTTRRRSVHGVLPPATFHRQACLPCIPVSSRPSPTAIGCSRTGRSESDSIEINQAFYGVRPSVRPNIGFLLNGPAAAVPSIQTHPRTLCPGATRRHENARRRYHFHGVHRPGRVGSPSYTFSG